MPPKARNRAGMDAEAVARMMAAQDQEEHEAPGKATSPAQPTAAAEPLPEELPARLPVAVSTVDFDPGKVDGRTLRRTYREPFATRIKPEAHQALRRIAYDRGITIAEALERAVAAFDGG